MLPDVRQVPHVAAVGQYRSFGRAAHALGMSQPGALSRSIGVLETALEVRPFDRRLRASSPGGRAMAARLSPRARG